LGLAAVDRVAELPAAHRLPAVARVARLRMKAGERRVALPARRDGAGDDALALAIAAHGRPELLDDADGLVTDDETALDRVLALEDVHVGAANRRRRDPQQRVRRPDVGDRLLVENASPRLDEYGRLHLARHVSSPPVRSIAVSRAPLPAGIRTVRDLRPARAIGSVSAGRRRRIAMTSAMIASSRTVRRE